MFQFVTQETWIKWAIVIHDNKYDYSKVNYIGVNNKITIICPIHGEFQQTPSNHLKGKGCRLCFFERNKIAKLLTIEEFIKRAKSIHGTRYDYSKSNYIGMNKNITIICPIHGEF